MSTMFVSNNNLSDGFTILTQVIPAQGAPALNAAQIQTHISNGQQTGVVEDAGTSAREIFIKRHPKALGAVQITVGVMTLLFGIVLTVNRSTLSVYSMVVYWGSIIFISAGSLSVASVNKFNPCMVKASLGTNLISAVTAGITIVLFSLDLIHGPNIYCFSDSCELLKSVINGITGVLLVFSLLVFIISICMALFSYDANHTEPTVHVSHQFPNSGMCCSHIIPFHSPSNQEGVYVIQNAYMNTMQDTVSTPPQYSET
ncbi:membrane-spanning 4-domains subfamily A member 4A-like [Trichomycterus rosablanca]|uniref:membrane-spanning 4-domains subfamily A member 4A-like n=1 Tax=Trichomycterus rosablanca TaxID=2290929 RepID=UPI002F351A1E